MPDEKQGLSKMEKKHLYDIDNYEEFEVAMQDSELRTKTSLEYIMFKDLENNHSKNLGMHSKRIMDFWERYRQKH